MIETGFGKEFSEPPSVTVSGARTHCEACQEPLDPSVMHKCHGNQEYQAPVFSSTEITEACPCGGQGVLSKLKRWDQTTYVVVCNTCRTHFYPELSTPELAISGWNLRASSGAEGTKWLADLPGDDERSIVMHNNVIQSGQPAQPILTNYKGVCPAVHVEGEVCKLCENTGMIPPTKGDAK